MQDFLSRVIGGNTVSDYLVSLLILVLGCAAVRFLGHPLFNRLLRLTRRTKTHTDDHFAVSIKKFLFPAAYTAIFYLAVIRLSLGVNVARLFVLAVIAAETALGAGFLSSSAVYVFKRYWGKKMPGTDNPFGLKVIAASLRILIWGIALILFLDNMGFKVNTMIAGLGVGGIAIAFAAQSILADIFCFFTIFFDRPFEIGDFIIAGDKSGTVENIGVKTTRLRALSGEQLVFSNADLTGSRIQNFKTMEKRRVLFTLGVTYDTTHDKLALIPEIIKSVVGEVPDTLFGRAHFTAYGAYSLNFEIVYFVLSGDYDQYMDVNHQINLRIKEEFNARGIEFAYPTSTVLMPRSGAAAGGGSTL